MKTNSKIECCVQRSTVFRLNATGITVLKEGKPFAMADDDDDVVFEGGELQKYLSGLGYKDFEVASPLASTTTSPGEVVNSFYHSASDWFRRSWTLSVKPVDNAVLYKHIQLILECGLIFEDDVHFVKNIVPRSQAESHTRQNTTWSSGILNLTSPLHWLSYNFWNEAVWPVTGSVMFCALWSWRRTRQNAHNLVKQKHMLLAMKDLNVVFWKATKLLQENELILRGFTLAKTGSTASRLENSDLPCMIRKWDSSPGLRIAVAKALIKAISMLSCATRQLITCCPLFGQLDNSSHYMSCLDEKDLGLVPDKQDSDVKLSHLKRLHHVYLLLQSEFLRRLSLCFCPELWRWKSLKQVRNVMQFVDIVTETSSQLHSNLLKEYQVFYSYGICEKIQDNVNRLPIQKSDVLKTSDAQDAIRSASLHLQVLLLNSRALEEKLEIESNNDNERFDDIISHLSSVIQELDVCRNCCEESIVQIKKLTADDESLSVPKENVRTLDKCVNTDTDVKVVHVGYTDLDPQVEDEIFEAEITEDTGCESINTYSEDVISNEQMQYEKAKQLSKRMMQELKSVLVIKAEKWKEREMKALQAKQISPEIVPSAAIPPTSNVAVASATSNASAATVANITSTTIAADVNIEQGRNEDATENISDSQKIDPLDKLSRAFAKPKASSLHSSPQRKEVSPHKLLQGHYTGSECYLERSTDSPVSNASSSSSQALSGRSPKHVYASETFRPLQNDLQFSVGLHLSSDALAKFQARNLGGSDTFSGTGEKSSSEESLVEDK